MSVQLNIHRTHRNLTNNQEVVEVTGDSVGACLNDLVQKHPGMKEKLFDKKGKLINVIEIFLNNESTYPDELKKPVKDGDEIYIALHLAGG